MQAAGSRARGVVFAMLWLCGAATSNAQPTSTTAARPDRAAVRGAVEASRPRRVILEGWNESAENMKVSDLVGNDLTGRFEPRGEQGKVSIALSDSAQFVAKPKQIATLRLPEGERITLPGGIVMPRMGESAAPTEVAWLRLTMLASPMPAPWDENARSYETELTFGLKRPASAPATAKPDAPVVIKVGFDGLTASALPPIVVEQPGLEHEKSVRLRFLPNSPNPKLLVRSSMSDVDLELRALPRVQVQPLKRELLGLGLGTVDVQVDRVAPHGVGMAAAERTSVGLQINGRATPEPGQPVLEKGASQATFRLRSAGYGPVQLTATVDGLTGSATVEQRFPTGPLLAVVAGGSLGGFARRFRKGARRAATGVRVLEGLVVSVVAFVASVLGVGFLKLPAELVGTEAGAFLIAALSGFAGVTVIESMGPRKAPPARTAGQTAGS
jgi:hypothetical protein